MHTLMPFEAGTCSGSSSSIALTEAGIAKVTSISDFAQLFETEIPRLRRYAPALTRDSSQADDQVQSCLVRAIAKEHLWQPGTDLGAWLFTVLHNQHANDVRRSVREGVRVPVEEVAPVLTVSPNAVASLHLRDLERAIATLPEEPIGGSRRDELREGCRDSRHPDRHRSLAPVAWSRDATPENEYQMRDQPGLASANEPIPAPRLKPLDPPVNQPKFVLKIVGALEPADAPTSRMYYDCTCRTE